MKLIGFTIAVLCLFFPLSSAFAADALNTGDTAWMIVATALVMVMTPAGLALFYGGVCKGLDSLRARIRHDYWWQDGGQFRGVT